MIKKINHIGIIVPDVEAGVKLFRDGLGMEFLRVEDLPDWKCRRAGYTCTVYYVISGGVNFEIDDEEKKFVISVIQLCNSMIERNNKEYKSNAIVYAMLKDCTFIEHNPIDDKYYLNLTAYRTVYFFKSMPSSIPSYI